jgi:hypothetical protein
MEFGADIAKRIVDDYALGNIDGKTILWNIGTDGKVFGGQIIGYNRQGYIRNDWRDKITVNLSNDDAMLVGWYCKEEGLHNDVEPIDNLSIGDVDERFMATPSIFGLHLMKGFIPSKADRINRISQGSIDRLMPAATIQLDGDWF